MDHNLPRASFLVFLAVAAVCCGLLSPRRAAALELGASAPGFVVPTPEGDRLSLADRWRDGPVLLAFVSPYCEACQETLQAVRRVEGTDVAQVVYVVLGPRRGGFGADAAPATVTDGGEAEANAYGVNRTPAFFLVGRGGALLWKHQGPLVPDALQEAVKDALHPRLLAAKVFRR